MTTRTLTRAEYDAKARKGHAGTMDREDHAANIWRQLYPDWDGQRWAIGSDDAGTYFDPINIRD
ncbi:hypothetical protein [Nocardia brasiliensis]|uniref:hypothetical protein n=1 Tax=Nocardia brasiliensis TaxID=37326 RepID=UPI00245790E2|nr:hypothetical protein [Nocardia brasiliensis]